MVERLWRQFSPYFHIAALILTLGITWGIFTTTVNAQGDRLGALETKQEETTHAIAAQNAVSARIEQKVDDIRDALNIRYRPGR